MQAREQRELFNKKNDKQFLIRTQNAETNTQKAVLHNEVQDRFFYAQNSNNPYLISQSMLYRPPKSVPDDSLSLQRSVARFLLSL